MLKNCMKQILYGFIGCLWRSLPLYLLAASTWLLVDAYDEIGYWAAILVFAGTTCLVGAIFMFLFFGYKDRDYEELSNKRASESRKRLDSYEG